MLKQSYKMIKNATIQGLEGWIIAITYLRFTINRDKLLGEK